MKNSRILLFLLVLFFGLFQIVNAQTTEATNAISAGSYLGTSNGQNVIFKKGNVNSGFIKSNSTAFGYNSLSPDNNIYENAAFGAYAMQLAVDAYSKRNTAIGHGALKDLLLGQNNTFVGFETGRLRTGGVGNTAIGFKAGGESGNNNTFVGAGSGVKNQGGNNTYLGLNTGYWNTNGSSNILIGYTAGGGSTATGGNSNILIGSYAGVEMKGGSNNIVMGRYAGRFMDGGTRNVILGENAAKDMNLSLIHI